MANLVRFVQVSDTHIFANAEDTLLGVNTRESLDQIIALLATYQHQYDFIVHSGDLSQDNSSISYQCVADRFNQLGKPVYFVPGNHDNRDTMSRLFPCGNWLMSKHIVYDNWQLILLNSQKDRSVAGYLTEEELQYLETSLTTYPDKFALIIFHHHPVLIGSAWLDQSGLLNADHFWQTVKKHPNAKVVCFGHVHQEYNSVVDNIACYGVPSTCIQFKPHHDKFQLEKIPPGFRLTNLHPDGSVDTRVIRLPHYVGQFDANATGY